MGRSQTRRSASVGNKKYTDPPKVRMYHRDTAFWIRLSAPGAQTWNHHALKIPTSAIEYEYSAGYLLDAPTPNTDNPKYTDAANEKMSRTRSPYAPLIPATSQIYTYPRIALLRSDKRPTVSKTGALTA